MAESSTTRTFKTPESPGALAVRVSAKSRCLSELTFFPIHETRRRTATARGIASKPLSRELYDRGAAECTEPHRGPWDSSVTGTPEIFSTGQTPAEARAKTLVERSVPRTSIFQPAAGGKYVSSAIASE